MDFPQVEEYLSKSRRSKAYFELEEAEREMAVFDASELLAVHFAENKLTPKAVALQVLYDLEGEEDEFGKLKRQGVKAYAVKGVSVSFEGSGVSQEVITLLQPAGAQVGRFY